MSLQSMRAIDQSALPLRGTFIVGIKLIFPSWHTTENAYLDEFTQHMQRRFFGLWYPNNEVRFPKAHFIEHVNPHYDICMDVVAYCHIAASFDTVPNAPEHVKTQTYVYLDEEWSWDYISTNVHVEFIPAHHFLER
jgi:hypothetical protein